MKNFYFVVGDEVYIKLNGDRWTIIDLIDLDKVKKFSGTWSAAYYGDYCYYAKLKIMRNGITKTFYMHTVILGKYDATTSLPDHRNLDGLDNRRNNLRIISFSASGFNRRIQSNNTSGFKGIKWNKKLKKWQAEIKLNGKSLYLGVFKSKSIAIETRLIAEQIFVN